MKTTQCLWLSLFYMLNIKIDVNSSSIVSRNGGTNDSHSLYEHLQFMSECTPNILDKNDETVVIQNILKDICNISELIEILGTPAAIFMNTEEETTLLQNSLNNCKEAKTFYNLIETSRKNITELTKDIIHLKQYTSVFLLLTTMETSSILLDVGVRYNLFTCNFIWILPYYLVAITSIKLPDVVLLLEINKRHSKDNCAPSFLNTAILSRNHSEYVVYELNDTTRKWDPVISKHTNGRVLMSNPGSYIRNPGNQPLRVVTIMDPPFIMTPSNLKVFNGKCSTGHLCWKTEFVNNTKIKTQRCCIGLCMDMLTEIQKDMGTKTELYLVEDGFYGSKVKGFWTGMVGDITYGKADVILAPIIASRLRETAVDFSEPYMDGRMALATMTLKETQVLFDHGSKTGFSDLLWVGIVLTTIVAAVIVNFIELVKYRKNHKYSLSEAILFFSGLTFQRDIGGLPPLRASSQVITQSVAMFMLIAISTYTAVLTANIVTSERVSLVSGWTDEKMTNPSEQFIYGVENNTYYDDKFRTSHDATWRHMHTFMKRHAFNGVLDGVQKLKIGQLHGIITDYYVLKYYMALEPDCQIQFAGKNVEDVGYSIAIQKGSPMKDVFSKLVLKYKDDLTIERLKEKWFSDACDEKKTGMLHQIGPIYFQNIFYACAATVAISLLILSVEHFLHCRNSGTVQDQNTKRKKVGKLTAL